MNDAIAKRVRELRKSKSMTQDELAERLHVTRQAVSNWEMGKTAVSVEYLTELAGIFGVTVEELISGKTSAAVYPKNQRKYIISSAVCGGVLALCLILCITLVGVLTSIRGKYFVNWPTIFYDGVWALMFLAAGGLLPSLASLGMDIRLHGWKRGLALGVAALCLILLAYLFVGSFFLLHFSRLLLRIHFRMMISMKLMTTALPLLTGLGLFLGLNR